MIYRFGPFELDVAAIELRTNGRRCSLEPQVFALLALLVENRERVVSKDEIVEKVWDGRCISDAAIASRVKSVRQALQDDGRTQRYIRTVHRRGFRFTAPVRTCGATAVSSETRDTNLAAAVEQLDRISRPSLAVLPFRLIGNQARHAALASALPDELITDLSQLRWLFVTARGSSFRLSPAGADFTDIGRLLRVRYCLCGTIEVSARRLGITVELVDTLDAGIVWAERFSGSMDDVHQLREDIRSRVLVALEIRIPLHEANRARTTGLENLDAWAAYHLGLQHIYRFNRLDNAAAAAFFERAVVLQPSFARAHAGLSFVHFQAAFMHYADDVAAAIDRARRCAERGLELDPLDPFVNFTMGRTYWIEGDLGRSLGWLERATRISPNYAQGIYAQAWTDSLLGNAAAGRRNVDLAMRLSPIDPLYYAMLATRGFTHMVLGEDADAAHWADRAARSPGAHVLIAMIAAVAHSLKGDAPRAAAWAANVRERGPALDRKDFFRAFPMQAEQMRTRTQHALAQLGF